MKKQLFSLALAATLAISATSFASPLHITKQGMFSAGGITITSPGTLIPITNGKQQAKARQRTLITPTSSTRSRKKPIKLQSSSCMVMASHAWAG